MILFKTLKPMRQIGSILAVDVELVRKVSNSYQPPVLFPIDDPVYSDGRNIYGNVVQYDTDGKPALNMQRNSVCTKFTRVPIPKEMQCLQ